MRDSDRDKKERETNLIQYLYKFDQLGRGEEIDLTHRERDIKRDIKAEIERKTEREI